MRPITFECFSEIPMSAAAICDEVADVARWQTFTGYAFLPGIASADYVLQTENKVGSRVAVRNMDGSAHIEDFVEWVPGVKIIIKLHEFTPPLKNLADHFVEEWAFETAPNATRVIRRFKLYPKTAWAQPFLWLISLLFRRAVAVHLKAMKEAAEAYR